MELVKLGKKGQISIPASLLRSLGLEGDTWLIAEAGENGSILLRPAAINPVELYSDERIREFDAEGPSPMRSGSRSRICSSCPLNEDLPGRERPVFGLPARTQPSVCFLRAGSRWALSSGDFGACQ